MSGAQGYYGVSPDLTIFGKVVAGGYPGAGGLGGKKEYMKYLSAGIEAGSKHKKALIGGTMVANPPAAWLVIIRSARLNGRMRFQDPTNG